MRREKDSLCGARLVARMNKKVGGYKREENNGDDAVHGEESGVEFTQVAGRDKRVLVEQQQGNSGNARERNLAQTEHGNQRQEQSKHEQVQRSGQHECAANTVGLWNGIE